MTGVGWSAFLQLGKVFRIVPWGSLSHLHRPVREKVMEGFTMATLLPLPSPWGSLLSLPWKHSVVPGGKPWKCEPPFTAQPLIASYSAYSLLVKTTPEQFLPVLWYLAPGLGCLISLDAPLPPGFRGVICSVTSVLWWVKESHGFSGCPHFSCCKDGNDNF